MFTSEGQTLQKGAVIMDLIAKSKTESSSESIAELDIDNTNSAHYGTLNDFRQRIRQTLDIVADDEAHATRLVKDLLSYFQGTLKQWHCAEQSPIWSLMPEDRRYTYDVRKIITTLADTQSFTESGQAYVGALLPVLCASKVNRLVLSVMIVRFWVELLMPRLRKKPPTL
ncbi:hypothetical protein HBA55_35320 [Pseudomaricurvus alkylphenolicus]|uniref:carboxyl transferase domain-containing protein n=1 Tax=Pseudomaricurvus alkylphenolicus TaxID=1306991 RepID=UPI001423384D|nr:carboxyl transferase domain-containing protein [Pseudomaricurvus alkylphenolicus]NIB44903.1 hypothetical protein [Pseudomaricurvus alkylphenolicus]